MAPALMIAILSVAAAPPPEPPVEIDARSALITALQSRSQYTGEAHALYIDPGTHRKLLVGYDYKTGAWYRAIGERVAGVDASGNEFSGRPLAGQVKPAPPGQRSRFDDLIEDQIPYVIGQDLLHRQHLLKAVARTEQGGFAVSIPFERGVRHAEPLGPGFDDSRHTVIYHFDATGLLVRAENVNGTGEDLVWDYSDLGRPALGIAKSGGLIGYGHFELADLRTSPQSDPQHFSAKSVETLAAGALTIADAQPLWFGRSVNSIAAAAEARATRLAKAGDPASPTIVHRASMGDPLTDAAPGGMRGVLILGGLGVIGAGWLVWWKRR